MPSHTAMKGNEIAFSKRSPGCCKKKSGCKTQVNHHLINHLMIGKKYPRRIIWKVYEKISSLGFRKSLRVIKL